MTEILKVFLEALFEVAVAHESGRRTEAEVRVEMARLHGDFQDALDKLTHADRRSVVDQFRERVRSRFHPK